MRSSYPAFQKSRDPSEPPLAKRPSWIGCQATATTKHHHHDQTINTQTQPSEDLHEPGIPRFLPVASFLCPRNTCSSSFRLRRSNSLHRWSRDAVSSQLPFRFHFTSITVFLWACLRHERNSSGLTAHSNHQVFAFLCLSKGSCLKRPEPIAGWTCWDSD